MFRLIIIFQALICIGILHAQTYPKHQAGVSFSLLSGAGINYLYEHNPTSVYQLTAFMYYEGNTEDERNIYANIGFEYQYNIHKLKFHRFYLLAGGSWWNLQDKTFESYTKNDIVYEIRNSKFNRIYNIGSGLGYEFNKNAFSVSIDSGFMLQSALNNNFHGLLNRSKGQLRIAPFFGISLRYIIQ